jgi:DNA-binding NarL/FixJ family response regulator
VEFKKEEFIERETEIASYLVSGLSIYKIAQKTGLGKKIIHAHIKNMMRKLKVENMKSLIEILKQN